MFKDFLVSTPNEKGKITTQTRKTQAGNEFSHARERCSHRCERLKNLVVH